MSDKLTQAQDVIVDGLNAANWSEVESEFGGQSVEQIKAELDKMFWSDTDINGEFAQRIFDELRAAS